MPEIKLESDLFFPIKKWLISQKDCTNVYAEVRDIDVVGLNTDALFYAVELKKTL